MPIESVPDHVAVAVHSMDEAALRWRDGVGGAWANPRMPLDAAGFATRQLRFRGGAKLELLEPIGHGGFAAPFLERFGARIHHVTLKVPDLLAAVEVVRDEGYDVVDVDTSDDVWHEAFLRPSQVGGMIVQIAYAGRSDAEWAAMFDMTPEEPAGDAAVLHGPTLRHDDLDAAMALWTTLGASVTPADAVEGGDGDDRGSALSVTWPGSPLDVRIERCGAGEQPGPVGLRLSGLTDVPTAPDPRTGPAILPVG